MANNAIVEIIKIVIWPIVVFLFLVLFTLFFQVQIRELLKKLIVRYKKGDTEFEVTQQTSESKPEPEKQIDGDTASVVQDNSPTILDSGAKSPDELMGEMIKTIFDGDFEKGENLYKQLQDLEREPVEKLRNEGLYYFYRYQRGDTSAINKIVDLTKNPDISHYAHLWLGYCYETSGDFKRAFDEYKLAVQEANSQDRRAMYIINCACSLHKNGDKRDALQFIMAEIAKASESDILATLYKGVASLYEMDDNYEYRGLALEKALEYEPNDTELLFDVAYSYSQVGNNELSLLHYKTLLNFSPKHDMALNNIGVAYSRLQMPIKSIDHQKKAFDLGNTLAASNLAISYIGAGFSDEATKIIEKAREQKEIHQNIGSAFSQISDDKEKERKKEKEIIDIARERQKFMRSFAEAYFVYTPNIADISGTWRFQNGIEVNIVQQKESFEAEWIEKDQSNKFKGQLLNRTAQINISESKSWVGYDNTGKLYVSPDENTINIMAKRYSNFVFMQLEKVQGKSNVAN